jgi:hypothetical protein
MGSSQSYGNTQQNQRVIFAALQGSFGPLIGTTFATPDAVHRDAEAPVLNARE